MENRDRFSLLHVGSLRAMNSWELHSVKKLWTPIRWLSMMDAAGNVETRPHQVKLGRP
jgi:hypothetical protein